MDRKLNDPSTPLVGIFADDLTGALDAAAPFAARGFRTVVSTSGELPLNVREVEVVSLNLATRHMAANAIADRTSEAVAALAGLGVKVLLNKVDSTLRGNPGVELVAALSAISGDHAVLCSAYPQNDRTVVNGELLVAGVPVAMTDVGQDRLSPLPSSHVDAIVMAALMRAGLEDRAHVRGPDGGMAIDDFLPVIITPDARSEDDLHALAKRLVSSDSPALVAGSAGIAVALADALDTDRPVRRSLQSDPSAYGRKIMIVTASQRSIIDDQLDVMGKLTDLVQAELSPDEAIAGVTAESIERMVEISELNGIVVLRLGKLESEEGADATELQEMAATIVRNLGGVVREIVCRSATDTLIVLGGDTTNGVLDACGVTSLELTGELQPGSVVARPVDGTISDVLLVTRAGGFGDENGLFDLVALLEFGHTV